MLFFLPFAPPFLKVGLVAVATRSKALKVLHKKTASSNEEADVPI